MSFSAPSSLHLTPPLIDKALAELLALPVDAATLSEAEYWLWSVLQQTPDGHRQALMQAGPALSNAFEPALLLGLLIGQRNEPNDDFRAFLADAEAKMATWLQVQLNTVCPDRAPATCLLAFYYLVLSQTDENQLTDWLTLLSKQQPLNKWNPGADLTLESGATGWLLVLLKARQVYTDSKRIQGIVSNVGAYLAQYIDYLHSHQIPIDGTATAETLFPTAVGEYEWKVAEQQSWSQGDLGHLLLLYEAERLFGQQQVSGWAHRLGGYLIHLRQMRRMQLTDVGLMTGMAGVSLLYRRLYQLTGKQRYLDEGLYWLHKTIRTIQQPDHPPDHSLKSGTLGVVCALNQWLDHDVGLDLFHL